MSIYNLDKIFRPKSVAVIGASEKPGSIGRSLIYNLMHNKFDGNIYPINPKYDTLLGYKAYPSIRAVKERVDLVIVATPIAMAPDAIADCGQAGVGGAIIISAGGKETGAHGRAIEDRIQAEAQKYGVRVVGPNCMGIYNNTCNLNASFASPVMPVKGKVAFISQSGAILSAIHDWSLRENIGFSHFISVGSMLDVDFGDLIDYLGNDAAVGSICLYVEGLTHIRKFMSAARAVSRVKPIVVLKSGASAKGAAAASSHTGSMTGEDSVYDAAFKRAGIVRVKTIGDLFDCASLMAKQPLPRIPGVAIVTNSGGPGVMAVDALAAYDLEPVTLSEKTKAELNECLPAFASNMNPVDILGDATAKRYEQAIETVLAAQEVHGLIVIWVPQAIAPAREVAEAIVRQSKKRRVPIFSVFMGGDGAEEGRRILGRAGIPNYETPERAVSAYMYMHSYARNLEALAEVPGNFSYELGQRKSRATEIIEDSLEKGYDYLTEFEAKEVLESYSIPVNTTRLAKTAEEAVRLAEEIGFPVVMKVHSRDIVHKSDSGGVKLNLHSGLAVEKAFKDIMDSCLAKHPAANIEGIVVQSMVSRRATELILGAKYDPDFGPVVLFGAGGTLTNILEDTSIALPPLNRLLARRLIEDTKIYKVLKGYRDIEPANLPLLEETLIRLSQLLIDHPQIKELDINPLLINSEGAVAVDARIIIGPGQMEDSQHLVISPYPAQYEMNVRTTGGIDLFVRPIRPEDAPAMEDLFAALSSQTIYFRFLSPLKTLPKGLLARFTQVDYDREIVLAAFSTVKGKEQQMMGVCRLMGEPDHVMAEMAILVGDPWQGKGVGAVLLSECLDIAEERGYKEIKGFVLPENTTMLALARKLGFTISKVPGSQDVLITRRLNVGQAAA